MKTVFNRALSLVMCLILICSTMSVMAFGANAAEDFNYKTYAQNATKENVHHLLDFADNELAKANGADNKLNKEIKLIEDIPYLLMAGVNAILERFIDEDVIRLVTKGNGLLAKTDLYLSIDLSSVDAICKTLDNYRGVIELATLISSDEESNIGIDLGGIGGIDLTVFDEDLSRAKSGDYKIFSEVLELAAANSSLIGDVLSDEGLKLGVIGDALGMKSIKIDISTELKNGIVNALFKGKPNYEEAKTRALSDFDAFVYRDVMGLVSSELGIPEDIKLVDADTTIDDLLIKVFDLLFNNYIADLVKDIDFTSLGYEALDKIVNFDNFKVEFTPGVPLLEQINSVLGSAFAQIVPNDNGEYTWVTGENDYEKIGVNMRGLVHYIAEKGLGIENPKNKDDDVLMLEILKIIIKGIDANGTYIAVQNAATINELADKLFIHLSEETYPADATYEHVLGNYIIEKIEGTIPLYDKNGNVITANGKYTVWEVINSVFDFFLVDKNLNAYFGMSVQKKHSYFDKLNEILKFTSDKKDVVFDSETYIKGLINSIFTVDLQEFVNLTAVKALGDGKGDVSVVTFLYNIVYNMLNNWSASKTHLEKYDSQPFQSALSNNGIANLVKVFIETLSARSEGTACLVGLIVNFITDINEKVDSKDSDCIATGYKTTKTCLKCNKAYLKGATIAAKGHKYDAGKITKAPTCTAKGTKTFTCTVCGNKKYQDIAATGHKASGYKTTKAATYKTKGLQVNKCTVCGGNLGEKILNTLTLNKPTGLKFSALSTTSIKFSWNKVTGAEAYTLYYRAGSGKWKAVNAKNKTSVTVKKLKAGTTYKFKVVAVAGSNKSADSSSVSATTKPAKVSLKSVRSKKKKEIIVEWKKLAGVTGYEVQYSTSKKFTKKTTKTATIKKQKTVKTYIKKLKSKKTYYVKVRAYKTVNKVKVYGAYSKVKNIKCK